MRYRSLFLHSAFIFLLSCNLAAAQALLKTWMGKSTDGTMGQSLGKIGDIDGDQVEDIVIGEPGLNSSSPGGRVYVVSGKAGTVLHEIWCFPPCTSGRFGYSVSGLGDVNQDGVGDFAVGSFPGEIRVYSGATGSVLLQATGAQLSMGGLGISVSGIGDSNQDGVADILLGSETGVARLVSGADASMIFSWSESITTHQFGSRVVSAGDVDGDGVQDVLVGAPGVENGQATQNGYVKVFSGANGQLIHTVNPIFPNSSTFGSAIAGIGDINADGNGDFMVGSYLSGVLFGGNVSVYSGQDGSLLYFYPGTPFSMYGMTVSGVGDVNGDATPDFAFSGNNLVGVKVYSGVDGSQIFSLIGTDSTDIYGASLLGAGDTNGDEIEDLVVGITHYPVWPGGPAVGRVALYAGSTAVFKNYGTSALPGLTIHGKGVPAIGAAVSVDVNAPSSAQGLLVVGSQAANLPWHGGTLLVDPLYVFPHTTPSGLFSTLISIPFQIPQDPSLLGSHFYFQGAYKAGPAGIVYLTDGLEMSVK